MKIKQIWKNILAFLHRVLLHFGPYRKWVYSRGLDSLKFKRYYRALHFDSTEGIACSDVDGYKNEGDNQKVVELVDNLAGIVPQPEAVLDIGCGTGRYLKQMEVVWPGTHLEGVDISGEIVEKFTCKLLPGVPIHVLDIEVDETFHIENRKKFDLVCMIGIIQVLSLKSVPGILDRVNELCKEGGYLYVQFNVETEEKKSDVGYKRYSIDELETLLAKHGFTMIESSRTDILKDYAYIVAWKTLE
jgi:predicted TPR repeat methyltransferase